MISLSAYQTLSDSKLISIGALRFFVQLMARYDLRRFRAIPPPSQAQTYFGCTPETMTKYLGQLVRQGILELGPVAISTTYRIAAQSRLSVEELDQWTEETRQFRARFDIVPEQVPEDPLEIPGWLAELRVPGRRQ
jgi:hypothetical protein